MVDILTNIYNNIRVSGGQLTNIGHNVWVSGGYMEPLQHKF